MRKKVLCLLFAMCFSIVSCDVSNKNSGTSSSDSSSVISSSNNISSISSSQTVSTSQNNVNNSSSNLVSSVISSNQTSSNSSSETTSLSSSTNSSSSSFSSSVILEKYTVTWKNYDGLTLEVDEQVVQGSVPSYDGNVPTKASTSEKRYIFSGWSPSIEPVVEDITYTATFVELDITDAIEGIDPTFSSDGKTVKYGFYPQSYVSDENLIKALNSSEASSVNGWYLYENEYYTKVTSKVYNNVNYKFNDGTSISNNKEYWFKCEPITWNIINAEGGKYYLISSTLLDVQSYYDSYQNRTIDNQIIYANNYEHSLIRTWLNNDFFNTAFSLDSSYIVQTTIDNSGSSTNMTTNQYACSNTLDKVFLPSYQDYINTSFGFENDVTNVSSTRECKTTDYVRVIGGWSNLESKYLNSGVYWTRSPSSEYKYTSWVVNSSGYLTNYAVDGTSHCVRPAITISLS